MSTIKRILVVDDDVAMKTLLLDFLQRQGYSVTATSSVEGALSYLNSLPTHQSPNLVVSDVKMGIASGIDLAKKLSTERPLLPVILFSVFEGHKKEALKNGASKFLRKPFALAVLATAIAELLNDKK